MVLDDKLNFGEHLKNIITETITSYYLEIFHYSSYRLWRRDL